MNLKHPLIKTTITPLHKRFYALLMISHNQDQLRLSDLEFLPHTWLSEIKQLSNIHPHLLSDKLTVVYCSTTYSTDLSQDIEFIVKRMRMMCNNSQPLLIYLLLLNHHKYYPSRRGDTIDTIHVNSGQSTFYSSNNAQHNKNGIIHIWRKDEWRKVLIHELIHAFHVDDNYYHQSMSHIRKQWGNISSSMLLSEIYAETMAIILYRRWFCSTGSFIKDIQLELRHNRRVVSHILYHYGYKCLSDVRLYPKKWKENTNVWSYYVGRLLLLSSPQFIKLLSKTKTTGIHHILSSSELIAMMCRIGTSTCPDITASRRPHRYIYASAVPRMARARHIKPS